MSFASQFASVEAWLTWFEVAKSTQCRAYLCTSYGLNTADAEALINTARLQIFLHWSSVKNPLAYVWRTLKHAAGKQRQRRTHERRQLEVYALQQQVQAHSTDRTVRHVTAVLEQVSSRQRQLLEWYAQGYEDTQVAVWLQTTPQAVRVARHGAYCALRAKTYPPADSGRRHPGPPQRNKFLGAA